MIFVLSLWYDLSCQFVSLAFACVNSLAFFLLLGIANDLSLPVFIANFLLWVLGRLEG